MLLSMNLTWMSDKMDDKIRIGYACITMTAPFRTNRRFNLKNLNEKNFTRCVSDNLNDLQKILVHNLNNNIKLFRISSDIIPFGSHEENIFSFEEKFEKELTEIGKYIINNDIRISMHPGQYTVLNSPKDEVVIKAIRDIEYHNNFLDSLKVSRANKIILHIGGLYNDKASALKRFIINYGKLSKGAKKRIAIENDDKSFNIEDVLSISSQIGVPVVFDNLHHFYNNIDSDLSLKDILINVKDTWKEEDGPMKLHYSDMDESKKRGAHSKTVNINNFMKFYEEVKEFRPHIMLEVKDKDISVGTVQKYLNKIDK